MRTLAVVFRSLRATSVFVEEFLDLVRRTLSQQRQREKDPRLLRIQFIRCDEAQFVVGNLNIPAHGSRWHARAPHDNHALFYRLRSGVDRGLVHIPVSNAGDHDAFGAIRHGTVDEVRRTVQRT